MRTVYLGTSAFAVAVLERLAASDHRPALVVTRPDRPKGRGRLLQPPPVPEAAGHGPAPAGGAARGGAGRGGRGSPPRRARRLRLRRAGQGAAAERVRDPQ